MAAVFGLTGPTFLTAVDWENPHHRRSIAASLVNGVYIHERDRQKNRKGPDALAPPWWEFFGFRLINVLVDDADSSYFGALFEFTLSYHQQNYPGKRPPKYVMAFRGTINTKCSIAQDWKSNLRCALNLLHGSRRFEIGIQATSNIISKVGPGDIWLAGHSLGSYLALLIGRHMAKNSGYHLESYLFNPPFISVPLQILKFKKMRFALRLGISVLTASIVAAARSAKKQRTQHDDPFVGLSSWIPNLFVNPNDLICCEYAGYFEHRERMESFGIGNIGRMATKHSAWSLVSGHARGTESEAVHLIPSANLTTNCSSNCSEFNEAHRIQQWWKPDLELVCKVYQYQSNKRLMI